MTDPVSVTRIALEDVTPVIAAIFADDVCLIWSGEWQAYWRDGGNGYTKSASAAGWYTISAAYERTRHCGPEKRIAFERVSPTPDTCPAAAGSVREALAWYGEQARLARLIHSEGDAGRHALAADGGKRAQVALAAAPTPDAAASENTCPFCTGASEYQGSPEDAFCERHLRLYRKASAA